MIKKKAFFKILILLLILPTSVYTQGKYIVEEDKDISNRKVLYLKKVNSNIDTLILDTINVSRFSTHAYSYDFDGDFFYEVEFYFHFSSNLEGQYSINKYEIIDNKLNLISSIPIVVIKNVKPKVLDGYFYFLGLKIGVGEIRENIPLNELSKESVEKFYKSFVKKLKE